LWEITARLLRSWRSSRTASTQKGSRLTRGPRAVRAMVYVGPRAVRAVVYVGPRAVRAMVYVGRKDTLSLLLANFSFHPAFLLIIIRLVIILLVSFFEHTHWTIWGSRLGRIVGFFSSPKRPDRLCSPPKPPVYWLPELFPAGGRG
jgi:hypothetical protein